MKQQNKYEKLFDEFLDVTEFRLIRHQNDYNKCTDEYGHWSVIDLQGADLGHIEGDRFESARDILDRMDIYIHDYIIEDLQECLDEAGYDLSQSRSAQRKLAILKKTINSFKEGGRKYD